LLREVKVLFAGSEEAATEPPPYTHHDCRLLGADALVASCQPISFNSFINAWFTGDTPLPGVACLDC
jgi:hypothetical protein